MTSGWSEVFSIVFGFPPAAAVRVAASRKTALLAMAKMLGSSWVMITTVASRLHVFRPVKCVSHNGMLQ